MILDHSYEGRIYVSLPGPIKTSLEKNYIEKLYLLVLLLGQREKMKT